MKHSDWTRWAVHPSEVTCYRCKKHVDDDTVCIPTGKIARDNIRCARCEAPVCSGCSNKSWVEINEDHHESVRVCETCRDESGGRADSVERVSFCVFCGTRSAEVLRSKVHCMRCRAFACGGCAKTVAGFSLCPPCSQEVVVFPCPSCLRALVDKSPRPEDASFRCDRCGKRFCASHRTSVILQVDSRGAARRIGSACGACAKLQPTRS